MQRAPRRQLHPDFIVAVRASGHRLIALAVLTHFAAYTQLSSLLNRRGPIRASALTVARLQSLAVAVGYDGPLFADRQPRVL